MKGEWRFPNPATPPGSGSYYCVRCARADNRDDLALIFAWHHSLCDIPNRVSDRGVALAKLNWYREELQRSMQAESQHPMIQSLVSCIGHHDLPLAPFLAMTDAVEADIIGYGHQDLGELVAYCRQSGGALLELISRTGGGDAQAARCGEELGACVRLCEIIRDLGADLRQQRLHLPLQLLEKHALPPDQFDTPAHRLALHQLLAGLATEARQLYEQAQQLRPTGAQPALGPALGYCAIALVLLDKIEQADFPVLDRRMSLTPLHKLWLAWRANRRAARGKL